MDSHEIRNQEFIKLKTYMMLFDNRTEWISKIHKICQ